MEQYGRQISVLDGKRKDSEWLSHLGLNKHDEELLLRNQWLSDSHISAVGYLLKEQYPFIYSGIEDT